MSAESLLIIYWWVFTIAVVLGAIGTVSLRSLFHSAMSLILTLLGVAGYYLLLHAEFLAAVQIVVYVGAIMVLIIFAILVARSVMGQEVRQTNKLVVPALLGAAALFVIMVYAVMNTPFMFKPEGLPLASNTKQIGWSLMATYTLPFEIAGMLLFIALMGAIVIASRD